MATLRHLRAEDVAAACEISAAVGWNQTPADWRRMLALDAPGCLCVEADGRVVSTATALRYGRDVAWVGMVLTLPEYRGRGYVKQLLGRLHEWLDEEGVACARLDATDMGRPVYEKMGYVAEHPVERWRREPSAAWPATAGLPPARAYGWQGQLLDLLAADGESAGLDDVNIAYARPGRVAAYFGPCLAAGGEPARGLLAWFLARHAAEPCFWDLAPDHPAAGLAAELGFKPVRRLLRMRRGGAPARAVPANCWALAGFEYG
jgi:GNAT superfamily N-acetyltransferase